MRVYAVPVNYVPRTMNPSSRFAPGIGACECVCLQLYTCQGSHVLYIAFGPLYRLACSKAFIGPHYVTDGVCVPDQH